MQLNINELAAQLAIDEDLRLKPYRCTAGKLTIGVGRNLDDVGISKDEALFLLANDINHACDQLDAKLPWWRSMSERRMQALANLCFNLGISTLLTFKNSLALLQSAQYERAADAFMQSKWAKQVGARAVRVTTMIREG